MNQKYVMDTSCFYHFSHAEVMRGIYSTWAKEFGQPLAGASPNLRFLGYGNSKSARFRCKSSTGSYEIVTTRIYESMLPSSDSNVRGRRDVQESVVGGTEKLKHREENIRDSRGTA